MEEALFFLVTNLILLSASLAFDRCIAICRFAPEKIQSKQEKREEKDGSTQPPLPPYSTTYLPLNLDAVSTLWRAFVSSDEADDHLPPTSASAPQEQAQGQGQTQTDRIAQVSRSVAILKRASRSFTAASYLLPWDLRADLCALYAFCRASDNLIDELAATDGGADAAGSQARRKRERLDGLRKLSAIAYSAQAEKEGRATLEAKLKKESDSMCVSETGSGPLSPTSTSRTAEDATASAASKGARQAYGALQAVVNVLLDFREILPQRLWTELFDGYEMDVDMEEQHDVALAKASGAAGSSETRRSTRSQSKSEKKEQEAGVPWLGALETMEELEKYAQGVAGAIGEMCTRVVLHRAGYLRGRPSEEAISPREKKKKKQQQQPQKNAGWGEEQWAPVIEAARRMGVALQLVNISRDAVSDARELKRCYLPRELIGDDLLREISVEVAREPGPSAETSPQDPKYPALIRPHAMAILDLAQRYYAEAYPAIERIPVPAARTGLRVACAVYADIANAIRKQSAASVAQGTRASNTNARRIWVTLRTLYL